MYRCFIPFYDQIIFHYVDIPCYIIHLSLGGPLGGSNELFYILAFCRFHLRAKNLSCYKKFFNIPGLLQPPHFIEIETIMPVSSLVQESPSEASCRRAAYVLARHWVWHQPGLGDVVDLRSLYYELGQGALFSDLVSNMGIKVSPWLDCRGHHMK